ncbi:hypothetical protein AURDEDRAFT_159107 [Auricularia subglabra TFB-10046 SS5]|nr:hypothetical protein AURDEDRAFT_159107 [Auricularia subglabra TFB-10046 SS5]
MDLPLEILLIIAEFAAWEESWDDKGWVAGLTLVSRAFKAIVDPILYHCITIDNTNYIHLFYAASAGVPGFALTQNVFLLLHLRAANAPMNTALARAFAHVQYVAGQPAGAMNFIREDVAPLPRALVVTGMPHAAWFMQPQKTLRLCTHLHVFFDPSTWGRRGRPEPLMFRDLTVLTHLALDVADDDESPVDIYDAFAPCFPSSLQRFLFRTRWIRESPVFGMALHGLASERRDARLWLEPGPMNPSWTALRADLDDVRLGLQLWECGFQLYQPPRSGP